ncbi:MAG: NAD-dependent epimerase/dehydratase family protein [Candidatus Kapaibacterium sp.]
MNVLIIGGTIFLGKALITALQQNGHTVSVFHRGKHPLPEDCTDVKEYIGDRANDVSVLSGLTFDAVIDTCGYFPADVRFTAQALLPTTKQYIFISSISVYKNNDVPNQNEDAECGTLDDSTVREITGETYGPLKRYCEQEVESIYGSQACIIRPGLIVGPHDVSHRFTYWIHRVMQGGEILVPDTWNTPVQFIDADDIANFVVNCIEQNINGVYNLNSPKGMFTLQQVVETTAQCLNNHVEFIPVTEDFLLEQGVGAWIELPLWIPQSPEMQGFYTHSVQRAINNGLKITPLKSTIEKIISELDKQPLQQLRAGLSQQREKELISQWKQLPNTAL